jgi:hypothetical protein
MTSIITKNGQILLRDGAIGTGEACCCEPGVDPCERELCNNGTEIIMRASATWQPTSDGVIYEGNWERPCALGFAFGGQIFEPEMNLDQPADDWINAGFGLSVVCVEGGVLVEVFVEVTFVFPSFEARNCLLSVVVPTPLTSPTIELELSDFSSFSAGCLDFVPRVEDEPPVPMHALSITLFFDGLFNPLP